MSRGRKSEQERFWEKVEKTEGCWNWTAARQSSGYGVFRASGRLISAHRFAYSMIQAIPAGMDIDHICHNRACVNPDHLRLATAKENLEHRTGANVGSSSGVRGVHWHKASQKWKAEVTHNGRNHHCGVYANRDDAAAAALAKRLELFTHNDADRRAA